MTIEEKQGELLKLLHNIVQSYSQIWEDEAITRQIENMREDIANDFFTIVVLGEFKRGKSTFINALLGEKLLPADVTPTTATINAIMYAEQRRMFVLDHEGSITEGEANYDFLKQYVAGGNYDTQKIKYLKIGTPTKLLHPNVVLVDTPGVSDINEQRVQVTYDFIPRADVVIFLLDATSPVKRTEKEFIEEHLIKVGVDQILFIANKMDYIDEEEAEDVLEDITIRLKKCFKESNKLSEIHVLPLSASTALEGAIQDNKELKEISGILEIEEAIRHIIYEGRKVEQREKRYQTKLRGILELIKRDLKSQYEVAQLDQEHIETILGQIEEIKVKDIARKQNLSTYIERQKEDLLTMTQKSIYFYRDHLTEEMLDMIQMYKGTDFKEFIEVQLSNAIKKNMKRWVNTYAQSVEKVLSQLGQAVAAGLSNYFKQHVTLNNQYLVSSEQRILQNPVIIEADDISHVTTQAGIISAGMAGVMVLIGGTMIMPFISMAAFPLLQKKMLEGKLKEAKINVKPELTAAINQSVQSLYKEVERNITYRIEQLQQISEERYEQLVEKHRVRLRTEMEVKRQDHNGAEQRMTILINKLKELEEIKQIY